MKATSSIIHDPGKFEGEHVSIPHFYELSLDSSSDEDIYVGETLYSFFKVSSADRLRFPDLTEYGVIIWERSDGFVMSQWLNTEKEYSQTLAQYENESSEDE